MIQDTKFAVVEVECLTRLFQKMDSIETQIQKLNEKDLPDELSILEAAKELHLSKQRVYNLVYSHELQAIQHRRNGKVMISREEIARYKQQNVKSR